MEYSLESGRTDESVLRYARLRIFYKAPSFTYFSPLRGQDSFTFHLPMLSLSDYDYTLPDALIAQHPTLPPENARLLVLNRTTGTLQDKHFYDLPQLLASGTMLVFNDSKVVKARILFPEINGELLFLRLITPHRFEALVKPGKKWKIGQDHSLPGTDIGNGVKILKDVTSETTVRDGDSSISYVANFNEIGYITFTVESNTLDGRIITCSHPILAVLEQYGQMPLPPYIEYDPNDAEHYQPVVADASKPGSVAAPTAALHFSKSLLQQLQDAGIKQASVTLHVGIGTFKSVDVENITEYAIHDEMCAVSKDLFTTIASQKRTQKPLIAVGTTSTRTLESLPYLWKQFSSEQKMIWHQETQTFWDEVTQDITLEQAKKYVSEITLSQDSVLFSCTLYIYPGFQFRIIDSLITNFHLPKSSLLMLVAGYIGYESMKMIYMHAIAQQYHFFSFGDGMLVL